MTPWVGPMPGASVGWVPTPSSLGQLGASSTATGVPVTLGDDSSSCGLGLAASLVVGVTLALDSGVSVTSLMGLGSGVPEAASLGLCAAVSVGVSVVVP